MSQSKLLALSLKIFLVCIFLSSGLFAQRIDQDVDLANALIKKYGSDVDVACLNSTITVTFSYTDSKKALSPVSVCQAMDENLISLKDNNQFTNELYYNTSYQTVSDVKAYGKNHRPVDVFTVSGDAKQDNIFYSSEHYEAFLIPFSSLGEKERYTANEVTKDVKYFSRVNFLSDYPFEQKTIVFNIPSWLNVELKEENFDGYDITKQVTHDGQNTVYTYTAHSLVNDNKDESNLPSYLSFAPHVLVMVKGYTTPAGQHVNVINSMDDVYNICETLVNEAGNNPDTLKPLVNQLIQGKKTDIDKIKAIYYWVQDNIRYIAFENGIAALKPASCQSVYANKYGDCKGMANLLTVMLKDAGFDARRTWIGVDGIPYDFTTPTLNLFNHNICTLIYNGKKYYLDGVEKYAVFGDNDDWIEGRPVLIEDGNKYIEDKIPVEPVDRNKLEIDQEMTMNGDVILGKETDEYNGESKFILLNEYNDAPTDERSAAVKSMAEGGNKDIEVSTPVTSDLTNREIPATFVFNFTLKNQVNVFDNDTYINIDDYKFFENMVIDSSRYFDFRFSNRHDYVQNVTFTVPAGYKVKHVPDNLAIQKPNYSFTVTVTQQGNKIIYHKELIISNTIMKKKDFKTWNADLMQLKKIYDDQLILEKN